MNFISLTIKQPKIKGYSLYTKLDHKNYTSIKLHYYYTTQRSRHQNHGDSTNEQTAEGKGTNN